MAAALLLLALGGTAPAPRRGGALRSSLANAAVARHEEVAHGQAPDAEAQLARLLRVAVGKGLARAHEEREALVVGALAVGAGALSVVVVSFAESSSGISHVHETSSAPPTTAALPQRPLV